VSTASDRLSILRVVGPSDAGKTTVVERVVGRLSESGVAVATVKSIHHDVEPDEPGKDTHRHRTAGADAVVGITPSLRFRIDRMGKGDDETGALEMALADLAVDGYEVVVVEGFADVDADHPVVVVGDADPPAARAVVDTGRTADEIDVDRVVAWLRDD